MTRRRAVESAAPTRLRERFPCFGAAAKRLGRARNDDTMRIHLPAPAPTFTAPSREAVCGKSACTV
jgi:hypothetical protein